MVLDPTSLYTGRTGTMIRSEWYASGPWLTTLRVNEKNMTRVKFLISVIALLRPCPMVPDELL